MRNRTITRLPAPPARPFPVADRWRNGELYDQENDHTSPADLFEAADLRMAERRLASPTTDVERAIADAHAAQQRAAERSAS